MARGIAVGMQALAGTVLQVMMWSALDENPDAKDIIKMAAQTGSAVSTSVRFLAMAQQEESVGYGAAGTGKTFQGTEKIIGGIESDKDYQKAELYIRSGGDLADAVSNYSFMMNSVYKDDERKSRDVFFSATEEQLTQKTGEKSEISKKWEEDKSKLGSSKQAAYIAGGVGEGLGAMGIYGQRDWCY